MSKLNDDSWQNEHERIRKLEEEYSRRVEEIKRKKLESFNGNEQGKGKGQPESSSHIKVNLPASEGRDQLERTEAERNGNTYVVADFDWLDHDTKPEIYEQFTIMMSKGIRKSSSQNQGQWIFWPKSAKSFGLLYLSKISS